MKRMMILAIAALAGVALVRALIVSRPGREPVRPTPTPRPPAAAPDEVEAVPSTTAAVHEAQGELLSLCEERDRLLQQKSRIEKLDDFSVRIARAQIEIMKHIRDGERYHNAKWHAAAAREFERAEFKIRAVPYEIKSLTALLPAIAQSKQKAEGALSGTSTAADEHYRLAESYYMGGDFGKAKSECERAIQTDPNHLASRALLTEVSFILGKAPVDPQLAQAAAVRREQVIVESDQALALARQHFAQARHGEAEREWRKVLEYAKWLPKDPEMQIRREAALEELKRIGR